MDVIGKNLLLGLGFSIFIGLNGLIGGMFINSLINPKETQDSAFNILEEPYTAKGNYYEMNLSYHVNYSSNMSFYYFNIIYPVYFSDILNHPDPEFFGIEFDRRFFQTRSSSYWNIDLLKSINSTDQSDSANLLSGQPINLYAQDTIRTDNEHIAYEVDEILNVFSKSMKETLELTEIEPFSIGNSVFTVEILLSNGTLITLEQSKDDKVILVYWEPIGEIIAEEYFNAEFEAIELFYRPSLSISNFHEEFNSFTISTINTLK